MNHLSPDVSFSSLASNHRRHDSGYASSRNPFTSASGVNSAALEDYYHVTLPWRARYAAASMFNLKGTGDRDNNLIERTRAALAKT